MNDLEIDQPRMGWLIDGNPETEKRACMLRNTGTAIELTLPLLGMFGEDKDYGRWFAGGIEFGDDPDRSSYSYKPPRVLIFEDTKGLVTLVGCRAANSSSNLQVSVGTIICNLAVLGGGVHGYEKINGLRTAIPALAAWTRLSKLELGVEQGQQNRSKSVLLKLEDGEPLKITDELQLKIRSSWIFEKRPGSFNASENVELSTWSSDEETWSRHLELHDSVLDLVSIAAWEPFGYSNVYSSRIDDPLKNLAQENQGMKWSKVESQKFKNETSSALNCNFLYSFQEVGTAGIERWLKLRRAHPDVMNTLVGILRSETPWSESNLVQSGIALESLGYSIEVSKGGQNLNSRGTISITNALEAVWADMEAHPISNKEVWMERCRSVFISLKHPDKPNPDSIDYLNTLRENILLLRFWIGQQIGMSSGSLKKFLQTDQLSHEWISRDV